MQCPKDNIVCYRKRLQDVEVDVCPVCQGVWLEKGEVSTLTRHFALPKYSRVDELLAEWETINHSGTPPKDFWVEDALLCPKDGTHMKKHYFAGSTIGVDQCHACEGFWFGGGELQAVARYFEPNPDLDKAWQLVLQDQREWQEQMAELKSLPATVVTWVVSPVLGIASIGTFFLKMLLEHLTQREIDLSKDVHRPRF